MEIVDHLKEIGFNTYEAKVYIALLKHYPATGYEVSKLANIPQSRTYDTLKVLEKKHIVVATGKKPVEYTPINPVELTKQYKRKMTSAIDFLDKNLPHVKENYIEPIVNITGRADIYSKITEVIREAKKEIYLEIWSSDFKMLEQELLSAYNRNVEIRIVGYDNFKSNFGLIFEHSFAREIEHSVGGRMIILCCDDTTGIIGHVSSVKNTNTNIIWTKNSEVVFLIKEFIVHDMYLIDVEENLLEQMHYIYGKSLKRLKDKILGPNTSFRIH